MAKLEGPRALKRIALFVVAAATLVGCAIGPHYRPGYEAERPVLPAWGGGGAVLPNRGGGVATPEEAMARYGYRPLPGAPGKFQSYGGDFVECGDLHFGLGASYYECVRTDRRGRPIRGSKFILGDRAMDPGWKVYNND